MDNYSKNPKKGFFPVQFTWEISALHSHHLKLKFRKTKKYVLTFFRFGNKLGGSRPSIKKIILDHPNIHIHGDPF